MTKEEILQYLKKKNWDKDFLEKISEIVANYVVYQIDPDSYNQYSHRYYFDYDIAKKDFDNRDYVPSGSWCICILRDLTGVKENQRRVISSKNID